MVQRMLTGGLIVILIISRLNVEAVCPDSANDEAPIALQNNVTSTELVYSHLSHYVEMECCMTGVHRVLWQKHQNDTNTWQPLDPKDERFIFTNSGQHFGIKSTFHHDAGLYRCVGRKEGIVFANISRKFFLEVVPCDPLTRGPYPIAPLPCETTRVRLGNTLTLPCTGYFGCPDGAGRLVKWYVSRGTEAETHDWVPAESFSPRYRTETVERDGTEVSSNLTITDVSADDIDRKFRCLLASPQVIHGTTSLVVRLQTDQQPLTKEQDRPTNLPDHLTFSMILGIGGVLVTSLLTLMIACLIVSRIRNIQSASSSHTTVYSKV